MSNDSLKTTVKKPQKLSQSVKCIWESMPPDTPRMLCPHSTGSYMVTPFHTQTLSSPTLGKPSLLLTLAANESTKL